MTDDSPASGAPSKLTGRLLIVAAALMWSSAGFLAKAPPIVDVEWCGESVRGTVLAFWRSLFAAAVLAPFIRRPRWSVKLVPMTLVFAAMNVLYLSAISMTTAANANWLQATAPVWVFLATIFWLRESVNPRDWILLLFGMVGVGTILVYESQGNDLAGVLCGLCSGVALAAVVVSLRQFRDHDAVFLIALNHGVTALVLAPIVVWWDIWPAAPQLPYLIGLGVVQMGIPYVMFARGLRAVTGHEASGIILLEPVLMPIWVYLAWSEAPAWWTLFGGAMILAGLALRYFTPDRRKDDEEESV
jgi:DME family drug/metabolite transporter